MACAGAGVGGCSIAPTPPTVEGPSSLKGVLDDILAELGIEFSCLEDLDGAAVSLTPPSFKVPKSCFKKEETLPFHQVRLWRCYRVTGI